MAGYHLKDIPHGEYGELSKIHEEVLEALDAAEQGNRIMVLIELSDVIGAIQGYLTKNYNSQFNISDLIEMSIATNRAFQQGIRK